MSNSFQQELETPEMESIAALAENLVYRLPGCADLMVRKTIQEVAREFAAETKTLIFFRRIPFASKVVKVHPSMGGVVNDIRSLKLDGRFIPYGFGWHRGIRNDEIVMDLPLPTLPEDEEEDIPYKPKVPYGEEKFYGEAATSQRADGRMLEIEFAETPSLNTEQYPADFVNRHGAAIVSGVLAKLLAMANKPWSDLQSASLERINYENAKSEERMKRETAPSGNSVDLSRVL